MSRGHSERRDADGNARRSRRFENGSVNRVHPFELGYIGEEDQRRDHVRVIHRSRFLERCQCCRGRLSLRRRDLLGSGRYAGQSRFRRRHTACLPPEFLGAEGEIVLALICGKGLGESRSTKLRGTHLAESTESPCEWLLGLESTRNGYIEDACVFFYQQLLGSLHPCPQNKLVRSDSRRLMEHLREVRWAQSC